MAMTTNEFTYSKQKVIQALRYHFISRPEIKVMIVLVNMFAITSAALYFFKKVSPMAFVISSMLWFFLMIVFWFLLPLTIYRKEQTFTDSFIATLTDETFSIENGKGNKAWPWNQFSTWIETPHFYHLYFNSRSFFIIPKGAFNGDDVHEARKLLQEKIKK